MRPTLGTSRDNQKESTLHLYIYTNIYTYKWWAILQSPIHSFRSIPMAAVGQKRPTSIFKEGYSFSHSTPAGSAELLAFNPKKRNSFSTRSFSLPPTRIQSNESKCHRFYEPSPDYGTVRTITLPFFACLFPPHFYSRIQYFLPSPYSRLVQCVLNVV